MSLFRACFDALPRAAIVALLLSALLACGNEAPIKVGFVGGTTGRVADLGVAGRDGVLYAVEERNRQGGIDGHSIELVVRDDHQDPSSAERAIKDLVAKQVVAIIGPMTSSMGVVIEPLLDDAEVVAISPTVKTNQLSGRDDYFLRVTSALSHNAKSVAALVAEELGLKRFAVVYDTANRAFTEDWYSHFRKDFEAHGGTVVFAESFESGSAVPFLPLAERVHRAGPDGVLMLSNAIDTALLAQQLRKLGCKAPLFTSEWAFTSDLLNFGGSAVEGITSFHSFNVDGLEPSYLTFSKGFVKRFGYQPSFASVLAYDAANCLFAGLKVHPGREGLKAVLLGLGSYPGLQSQIEMDAFGDVRRKLFRTQVIEGHFAVVE